MRKWTPTQKNEEETPQCVTMTTLHRARESYCKVRECTNKQNKKYKQERPSRPIKNARKQLTIRQERNPNFRRFLHSVMT